MDEKALINYWGEGLSEMPDEDMCGQTTFAKKVEAEIGEAAKESAGNPKRFAASLFCTASARSFVIETKAKRLEKRIAALEKTIQAIGKPRVRVPAKRGK